MQIDCSRCDTIHRLDASLASRGARDLIAAFEGDGDVATVNELPHLPIERSALMQPGGGKMFGCLIARDREGTEHRVFAFSGMLAGRWRWPGWAEPCFDLGKWRELEARYDPEIATLTRRLEANGPDRELEAERAAKSRALMARYHALYELRGASGVARSLESIVGAGRMMSGMGDCCAPKLLTHARRRGWEPLSLTEFFVGTSRRPGQREHGRGYPPCEDKCGPLLDFLLCPRAC